MDIKELMDTAREIIVGMPHSLHRMHGVEVAPGWFNIYNEITGQSKTVLYHPESNLIFKRDYNDYDNKYSRLHLGVITIEGKTYNVRLPEFHSEGSFTAQEYVNGTMCPCNQKDEGYFYMCPHVNEVKTLTRCRDAHAGNWKVINDEVVLFDFDGIIL